MALSHLPQLLTVTAVACGPSWLVTMTGPYLWPARCTSRLWQSHHFSLPFLTLAPAVQLGQPERTVEDASAVLVALEYGAVESKEVERKLQQKALYRCKMLAVLAMQPACKMLRVASSHRVPSKRYVPKDFHHPDLTQGPAI